MKTTYYVQSGALKEIVVAENTNQAFEGAFMRALEKEPPILDVIAMCSVHGFYDTKNDTLHKEDVFIKTEIMLRKTGLIKRFTYKTLEVDEDLTDDD